MYFTDTDKPPHHKRTEYQAVGAGFTINGGALNLNLFNRQIDFPKQYVDYRPDAD